MNLPVIGPPTPGICDLCRQPAPDAWARRPPTLTMKGYVVQVHSRCLRASLRESILRDVVGIARLRRKRLAGKPELLVGDWLDMLDDKPDAAHHLCPVCVALLPGGSHVPVLTPDDLPHAVEAAAPRPGLRCPLCGYRLVYLPNSARTYDLADVRFYVLDAAEIGGERG